MSTEKEMVNQMLTIERLHELPLSERREGLEDLVVSEFKRTLMMTEDEDLVGPESLPKGFGASLFVRLT